MSRRTKSKPVSMPLTWGDLEAGAEISDFTIRNVADSPREAWKGFLKDRQRLP